MIITWKTDGSIWTLIAADEEVAVLRPHVWRGVQLWISEISQRFWDCENGWHAVDFLTVREGRKALERWFYGSVCREFSIESLKFDRMNVLTQDVPQKMGFRLKRLACRLSWELHDEALELSDTFPDDAEAYQAQVLKWERWRACDYQLCFGPRWHHWFFRYRGRH
jgi:hypothetical protein